MAVADFEADVVYGGMCAVFFGQAFDFDQELVLLYCKVILYTYIIYHNPLGCQGDDGILRGF